MRVLHVIPSLDPRQGGPVAALIGLCEAQARTGLQVAVVANGGDEEAHAVVARLLSHEVATQLLKPPLGFLRAPRAPLLALENAVVAADVVHIHGVWTEIQHQGARLARRHNTPYIVRPCGMLDPWSLAQSRLKKRFYFWLRQRADLNCATAIHFTTEAERDLASPLKIKAPALVESNGVDLAEFECLPLPGTFRALHPQIGKRPLLLFLSRMHPKKGLDLLIPAFAEAKQSDAVLVIAGPDENGYRAHVELLVSSHDLQERVIFTGMLKGRDRVAALFDADLFVLPSYQENFGIAVVEALAAGTPVVISDQVNIHEQISAAGVGGIVALDARALSRELSRWLGDPLLRASASSRTRDFVRSRYDWNSIAVRWTQHYMTTLQNLPKASL